MATKFEPANLTAGANAFRRILAVSEGCEGLFILGGSLGSSVNNLAEGKSNATHVGAPVVAPNHLRLGRDLGSLIMDFPETEEITVVVVGRSDEADIAANSPYFVSTNNGPAAADTARTSAGFSFFVNVDGSLRMNAAHWNGSAASAAQGILTGDDAPPMGEWAVFSGRANATISTVRDHTRDKEDTSDPTAVPRDPTTRDVMIGGAYSTSGLVDGTTLQAIVFVYSRFLSDVEVEAVATQAAAIAVQIGLTLG